MGALFRTRTVVADLIDVAGEAVAAVGLLGLDLLVASRAAPSPTPGARPGPANAALHAPSHRWLRAVGSSRAGVAGP